MGNDLALIILIVLIGIITVVDTIVKLLRKNVRDTTNLDMNIFTDDKKSIWQCFLAKLQKKDKK